MKLTIQLFAGLSDILQAQELHIVAEDRVLNVKQLKNDLIQKYPQAAEAIEQSFIARNQAYAADDEMISETDELALIPPVSGGGEL